MSMKELNKAAKEHGLTRGAGKYNGAPYWKSQNGRIISKGQMEDIALGH